MITNAASSVITAISDFLGSDDFSVESRIRTDLRIDGDDGWELFEEIQKRTGYRFCEDDIRKIFHDEADMVFHKVLLRRAGMISQKIHYDITVADLIKSVSCGKSLRLSRVK